LFLLFIPSILIWNLKKGEIKDITIHYRDIIRFQLTCWYLFILPGLFVFIEGGGNLVITIGIIFSGSFTILNTIKVLMGKTYKYFLMIEFKDIKQILILSMIFIPIAFAHNYFHEFGHWIIGKLLGYEMGISLNGVWLKEGHYISDKHGLYVGIGGPAFSILQALIFMLLIEKYDYVYAYPFVFFPLFSRFFSLSLGNFSAQDEAGISTALELGTYTVAIIVLLILFLIVLRTTYKLKFGLRHNILFFMACSVSKLIEIEIIKILK
jgi:hypothetical protein